MARYDYRCPDGHVTELVLPIGEDLPASTQCICDEPAVRVFTAPAAIHFKGRGFYATDVKGSQERRRRSNPGDKLARTHDPDAAAIVRSL